MDRKLARKSLIASARGDIRALSQPKGVRRGTWLCIQELLHHLAGYLPEPYPSERHLATKLGWSQTSVHRAVCRAESLGLLERNTRSVSTSRWDGKSYLLTCLSEATKAAVVRYRPESVSTQAPESLSTQKVGTSSSKKYGVVPPLRGVTPVGGVAAEKDNLLRAAMAGFKGHPDHDDPTPIGASEDIPIPASVTRGDPAVYLARLFDQVWREGVGKDPRLRALRPSSRPIAIRYLKGVMLQQVDVDVAESYIRQFPSRVVSGAVEIHEGKSPFQAFIGSWGQEQVVDPVEHDRLLGAFGSLRERQQERARRLAAGLDDGE